MLPDTPSPCLSTRVSGSARKPDGRARTLFAQANGRPAHPSLALAVLAIALCGTLCACQPTSAAPPSTGSGGQAGNASHASEPEAPLQLQYDEDRLFYVGDDPENPDSSALFLRQGGEDRLLYSLGYGSDHPYWAGVSLERFDGVLGCSGVCLYHQEGTIWNSQRYYAVEDTQPVHLIAQCYNDVWQADLDGDGQKELLSNYDGAYCYLDVYQRHENGLITRTQLNHAASKLLQTSEWCNLSRGEDGRSLTAQWTEGGVTRTAQLEGWAVLASGSSLGFDYSPDGESLGTFFWRISSQPGSIAACWLPTAGEVQTLLTLDYSVQGYLDLDNTIIAAPFSDVLGYSGAVFSYEKGGRQIQDFWALDQGGQPFHLALCDPMWQVQDLDGDGREELFSISQDEEFFFLYSARKGGAPLFVEAARLAAQAYGMEAGSLRCSYAYDGFQFSHRQDGTSFFLTAEALMELTDHQAAWTDAIPQWSDFGRTGKLD